MIYRETLPIEEDTADAIAHIIPARTEALGQLNRTGGEVRGNIPLNLTSSNQDHSAQFHGYLSEPKGGSRVRLQFWLNMMRIGFEIGEDDFSDLAPAAGE